MCVDLSTAGHVYAASKAGDISMFPGRGQLPATGAPSNTITGSSADGDGDVQELGASTQANDGKSTGGDGVALAAPEELSAPDIRPLWQVTSKGPLHIGKNVPKKMDWPGAQVFCTWDNVYWSVEGAFMAAMPSFGGEFMWRAWH